MTEDFASVVSYIMNTVGKPANAQDYYEKVYGNMLEKLTNGSMHLFESGDHPAMITNADKFYDLSIDFMR